MEVPCRSDVVPRWGSRHLCPVPPAPAFCCWLSMLVCQNRLCWPTMRSEQKPRFQPPDCPAWGWPFFLWIIRPLVCCRLHTTSNVWMPPSQSTVWRDPMHCCCLRIICRWTCCCSCIARHNQALPPRLRISLLWKALWHYMTALALIRRLWCLEGLEQRPQP